MFSGFLYILHKNAYMQTNPVFPSINEASELIVAPEDLLPVSCAFEVYIHVFYYYLLRHLLLYNNILDLSTFICSFIHAFFFFFSGRFPAAFCLPLLAFFSCFFRSLSGLFQLPFGGADEILDQMRSLTGGGHAHVFLRRKIEGCSALHPV